MIIFSSVLGLKYFYYTETKNFTSLGFYQMYSRGFIRFTFYDTCSNIFIIFTGLDFLTVHTAAFKTREACFWQYFSRFIFETSVK